MTAAATSELYAENADWEVDREVLLARYERRAWAVTGIMTAIAIASDKHYTWLYVLARERYNWSFLQMDYETVSALATPKVFDEYAAQFDGPGALQTKLGDATEWKVRVVNIRLEPQSRPGQAGVAVVTFVKQVVGRERAAESESRYLATVAYEYHPKLRLKEKDRVRNPFGFVVTAYRADPDISSSIGKAGS
jgi:type IV secretion system protein VirB8